MKLSILDQSPIAKNSSARQALLETVRLAQLADELGYNRFWVSEHHNTTSLAGSTPEVLIAHLASLTKSIRLGSGGVMLPHYSSLKVAENFRMLEALFPNRIDLGVGRAPGGDRLTASLLNSSNKFSEEDFVRQLFDLQNYLNDISQPGSVQEKVRAIPVAATVPEQWILSSSGQSAYFAAHFGMGFSFAHFINPMGGPAAVKVYKERFRPSVNLHTPAANVAVFFFCAEDEELVRRQQAITDYRFVQFETKGKFDPVDYDEIADYQFSELEYARVLQNRQRVIMGTPRQVKIALEDLAREYAVDEIFAVNIASDLESRLNSYRLLAETFDLKRRMEQTPALQVSDHYV